MKVYIKGQFIEDDNPLLGVETLRACVSWLNSRNEGLNENKTPIQLLNEFLKSEIN